MADGSPHDSPPQDAQQAPQQAPLGSWPRLYALCCVLAIVVMVLLYWFSQSYNIRPGN